MVDLARFSVGLSVIAMQLNQPMGEAKIAAFHMALEDETDSQEWVAFCRVAARRFGWKFLPSVPDLLDALREFRGEPALEPEAAKAYEAVIASGVYTAEGTTWSYREVEKRCGRAAAEAFLEAGGHHAFAGTWGEDRRRERFIAAYVPAARAQPAARLLAPVPEERKALPGRRAELPPSDTALVRTIAALAGAPVVPLAPQGPAVVVLTTERQAYLEAQKLAILDAEAVAR